MKNKYNICVVDFFPESWLNKQNQKVYIWDILSKKLNNNDMKQAIPQGHGVALYNIIRTVNPRASICVVPISASASLEQIVYILSLIIEEKAAEIVNVSFGFFLNETEVIVAEINEICKRAKELGICIVCAESNDGKKAYPAESDYVISVRGEENCKSDVLVRKNSALVKYISLYVGWYDDRTLWVHGNSFYAAIVSGILSRFKTPMAEITQHGLKVDFEECLKGIDILYGIADI